MNFLRVAFIEKTEKYRVENKFTIDASGAKGLMIIVEIFTWKFGTSEISAPLEP